MKKYNYISSVSVITLLVFFGADVSAQEAPDEPIVSDQVVVTAQRRSETINEVPGRRFSFYSGDNRKNGP